MYKMNNIVGIIDMDGFTIGKKFYCKELGLLKVGNDVGKSYLFDIGIRWESLTKKDQKHCMFLTKNIHKLPFDVPPGSNHFPLVNLNGIVKRFYDDISQNKCSTIGYKGGHFERDLLNQLHIPSINLEDFGCPKAEFLFNRLVWLETCGHHIETHVYQHCPKVEVEAFGNWINEEKM